MRLTSKESDILTRRIGRGVRRAPGQMNKLELAYALELGNRKLVGEILHYDFEAIKLKLAPNTFYTPDFFVMLANGELEFHEVKGYWEDDARVKIKCAADKFPFRFIAVKKVRGDWDYEQF